MKNAILLLGILLTVLLCVHYLLKEPFTDDNNLSFLGINNSGLVLCGPNCGSSSTYKTISTPERSLRQVVYNKGMIAILSDTYKIYVCRNCPLHQPNLINETDWVRIQLPVEINQTVPGPTGNVTSPIPVGTIKRISLDKNHVFALDSNGNVIVCKNCNLGSPTFEFLKLPADVSFYDFSARDEAMVGLDIKNQKIYGLRGYDANNPNWKSLSTQDDQKNNLDFSSVSLGPQGYHGQGNDKKGYFCSYNCDGVATNWKSNNLTGIDQINYSGDYLSAISGGKLKYCKYPCSNSSDWKTFDNSAGITQGEVFSYVYPTVQAAPTIPPPKPVSPLLTKAMTDLEKNTTTLETVKRLAQETNRNVKLLEVNTKKNNANLEELRKKSREEKDKLIKQLKLSQGINEEFLTELVNKPSNAVVTLDEPVTTLLTGKEV